MTTINAQTIIDAVMQAHATAPDADDKATPSKIKFQTSERGFHTICNTRENLARFADTVRKNARLFGGGLAKAAPKARTAAAWPAQLVRLVFELLQDKQHQDAAELAQAQCGAAFYEGVNHKTKDAQAFLLWAPQSVEGLSEEFKSARGEDGRYCVYQVSSGASLNDQHRTRKGAEEAALKTWGQATEEKRAQALASFKPCNQAAARLLWLTQHGIITQDVIDARIDADTLAREEEKTLGQRFDEERAKRKAAREAQAAHDVAQVVAGAFAAAAIDEAMKIAEPELCEAVTCQAGEDMAKSVTTGATYPHVAQTVKISSGEAVLAKTTKYGLSAYTFSNRTQAQKAAAKHGGDVVQRGRPFFVSLGKADQAAPTPKPAKPATAQAIEASQEAERPTVKSKSGNWSASLFNAPSDGRPCLCFMLASGKFKAEKFATPGERMQALQAMAREADQALASAAARPAEAAPAHTPTVAAASTPPAAATPAGTSPDYTAPRETSPAAPGALVASSDNTPRHPRAVVPDNGAHYVDETFEAWTYQHHGGRFGFVMYLGKSAKPYAHYGYPTEAKRDDGFQRYATEARAIAAHKAKRKAESKAQADKPHGLKVGDVVRNSWGYDQTNVAHYQITKIIGKRTVEVRQLAEHDEATGSMSGRAAPIPGDFVGEVMRRQVDNYGQVNILSATYGRASKIEPLATVHGVRCYAATSYSSYA